MASLTTLAAVKAYLGLGTAGQDALIPVLIARESGQVERWTGRQFPVVTRTSERLNGTGSRGLALPDSPILSVSSLLVDGVEISAAANAQSTGYLFDDDCLYLTGATFPRGYQNVECSWVAGYQESETNYVPAGSSPVLIPTTGGTAAQVISVYDVTSSTTLTEVGSAPATGQFTFSDGVFTFNTAQDNHSVRMTYYYVPGPVEQAVIEMVALDLQQRSNIGVNSKTLGGETLSYEKKGMPDSVMEMLRPFRKIRVY